MRQPDIVRLALHFVYLWIESSGEKMNFPPLFIVEDLKLSLMRRH